MAPSPVEGLGRGRARAAGAVALADQGVGGADTAPWRCRAGPAGACLTPGSGRAPSRVRAQVAAADACLRVSQVTQPPSIRVEADNTVPYGTFREDRS